MLERTLSEGLRGIVDGLLGMLRREGRHLRIRGWMEVGQLAALWSELVRLRRGMVVEQQKGDGRGQSAFAIATLLYYMSITTL